VLSSLLEFFIWVTRTQNAMVVNCTGVFEEFDLFGIITGILILVCVVHLPN